MKLHFLPGDLFLIQDDDGRYKITLRGLEVFRGRSQRAAAERFNALRKEMEIRFPARQLAEADKAEILRGAIADSLVLHNSLGGRKKKKTTAGSTRTFGG